MTQQVHNTVFISYRRSTSSYLARAIYMDLKQHGYDVFMDVQSIDSGQFDEIILRQIEARAHFLLLCTPGTFDRINDHGDWLRREIEHAMLHGRNIVPILASDFKFDAATTQHFVGKLAELPRYNALNAPHDYFEEALERLRARFLKLPVGVNIVTTPTADVKTVAARQAEIESQPQPTEQQLTAEEYLLQGIAFKEQGDNDKAIAEYNKALEINPTFAEAYARRGSRYAVQGKVSEALADYQKALSLDPSNATAYNNRGNARQVQGDLDGALADYNEALRLNPKYADAYNNRGAVRKDSGDLEGAMRDYNEAIRLDPNYINAYYNLGEVWEEKVNFTKAIADFQRYLDLGGGKRDGDQAEVEQRIRDLKKKAGIE